MSELTKFQQLAARQGIAKLLYGETFYTSDVSKLAELLGRQLGGSDWVAMQPLHCVKWGSMDPELRRMLREKVLEVLGLPEQTIDIVEQVQPKEKSSEPTNRPHLAFWKRF